MSLFGIFDWVQQEEALNSSENIAKWNLAYSREYNNTVWDRADRAYQIAAADLQKAGLSKTLAAGNPAAVGGQTSAPQMHDYTLDSMTKLGVLSNVLSSFADVKQKLAQTNNLNTQNELNQLEVDNYAVNLSAKLDNLNTDTEYKRLVSQSQAISNKYQGQILDAQINEALSNVMKNYASADEMKANMSLILKTIDTEVLSQAKLTAEIKQANLDYARAELEKKIREYDFGIYSKYGYSSSGPLSDAGRNSLDTAVTKAVKEATGDNTSLNLLRKERWKDFAKELLGDVASLFRFSSTNVNSSSHSWVNNISNSNSISHVHTYREK